MKVFDIVFRIAMVVSAVIILLAVGLFLYTAVSSAIDSGGLAFLNQHDDQLVETDNGKVYAAHKNVYALENIVKTKDRSMEDVMDYYKNYAKANNLSFEEYFGHLPFDDMYIFKYTVKGSDDNSESQKYRDYLLEKGFTLLSGFRYIECTIEDDFAEAPACKLLAEDNLTSVFIMQKNTALIVEIVKYKPEYQPVPIDSLILSEPDNTYTKGETFSLKASYSPAASLYTSAEELERVEFESSDTGVIVVSESSYYTGDSFCSAACVGAGTATITANAPNGISESFTVTVMDSSAVIGEDKTLPDTKSLSGNEQPLDKQTLFKNCSPAVFSIESYGTDSDEALNGSGFFISENGLAVTCQSVIGSAGELTVHTADGATHPAIVIRSSKILDLALIKVVGSGFPYIEMCEQYSGGDTAYLIGASRDQPESIYECNISDDGKTGGKEVKEIKFSSDASEITAGCVFLNEYGQAVGVAKGYYVGKLYYKVAMPLTYLRHFAFALQ